jgi:hypothetical protein
VFNRLMQFLATGFIVAYCASVVGASDIVSIVIGALCGIAVVIFFEFNPTSTP